MASGIRKTFLPSRSKIACPEVKFGYSRLPTTSMMTSSTTVTPIWVYCSNRWLEAGCAGPRRAPVRVPGDVLMTWPSRLESSVGR